MRSFLRSGVALVLLVFCCSSLAVPQLGRDRDSQRDPTQEKLEHQREKAMNKERQESLKKDTDKLLQLANELKQAVDKSDENMLSLDVMKKADEIQKLAKQVREKMKGYGGVTAPDMAMRP